MTDNLLQIQHDQPVAANAPASLAGEPYTLDWGTTEIDLGHGRKATLRRPEAPEVIAVDAERQLEVPFGQDGSYSIPDPTINESVDAKFFDLLKTDVTGYDGEMPEQHKAAAVGGLYNREIYVDEEWTLGDGPVPVIEEIGGKLEPDFTVLHVMRQPSEGELKLYRRKSVSGQVKPGRRGRQIFRQTSNLKTAMSFYAQWMIEIRGATVAGETYSDDNRDAFIAAVDPLIQRGVVEQVVNAFTAKLSD